jgi:hypothetical protein
MIMISQLQLPQLLWKLKLQIQLHSGARMHNQHVKQGKMVFVID